ncbi:hypothetical protein [Actinomadura napierensis]|uniref:Uncharacterized protein n=1 Tax=Actinomadura napierensis TaxID=267854 RepID=A0ABP5LKT5_9ACTN
MQHHHRPHHRYRHRHRWLRHHRLHRHQNNRLHQRDQHGVADVLAAYAIRPATIDRAEAWRRADSWFNREADPAPVGIAEFPDGFAAWRVTRDADETAQLAVIDRRCGMLTLWPPLPLDTLAGGYRTYRQSR